MRCKMSLFAEVSPGEFKKKIAANNAMNTTLSHNTMPQWSWRFGHGYTLSQYRGCLLAATVFGDREGGRGGRGGRE